MAEANEDKEWKQKYLKSLDELEAKEKRWLETENILRQGLARLTLVADSQDAELTDLLAQLRQSLREGMDERGLRRMLEAMVEPIRRLDEVRQAQQRAPALNELLETLLARIEFPAPFKSEAKALQKRLLQASPDAWEHRTDDVVALLMKVLRTDSAQAPTTAKSGLLGKWFGGSALSSPSGQAELALAQEVLSVLLAQLSGHSDVNHAELAKQIQQARQQGEILRLARELAGLLQLGTLPAMVDGKELDSVELMLRLLERLEVPTELQPQAELIRESLAQEDVCTHMEKVIVAIADLVQEMRHRLVNEKQEIENFLAQLTERLRELDEGFRSSVENHREAFEGGRQLNQQVDEQIDGLTESVDSAQDLPSLKQTIAERVETIRSHMYSFRQEQGQRLQQAETQVSLLSERLDLMQHESRLLREKVKQEHELATHDPLTGVSNRLAYEQRLATEYASWKRYRQSLVLAVWDVDRFKSVNDTYGHQAGDKVLTVIAKLLQKQIRETDFVARFGGEEFVVLMPNTDIKGAAKLAEHLRKSVEQCEFHFRSTPVPITISCGMSEFTGEDEPDQVFARADAALYKAKQGGRNQCVVG